MTRSPEVAAFYPMLGGEPARDLQFARVFVRQPDGEYRFALSMGAAYAPSGIERAAVREARAGADAVETMRADPRWVEETDAETLTLLGSKLDDYTWRRALRRDDR